MFGRFPLSSILVADHPANEPLVVLKDARSARLVRSLGLSHSVKTSPTGDEFFVFPIKAYDDVKVIEQEFPSAVGFTEALCRGQVDLDSGIFKRELSDLLENRPFESIQIHEFNQHPVSDSDGELLD